MLAVEIPTMEKGFDFLRPTVPPACAMCQVVEPKLTAVLPEEDDVSVRAQIPRYSASHPSLQISLVVASEYALKVAIVDYVADVNACYLHNTNQDQVATVKAPFYEVDVQH